MRDPEFLIIFIEGVLKESIRELGLVVITAADFSH
jgi:hypothetical protein